MTMHRTAAAAAIFATLFVQSASAATAFVPAQEAFNAPAPARTVMTVARWRDADAVRTGRWDRRGNGNGNGNGNANGNGNGNSPADPWAFLPPGHGGTIPGLALGHDDDAAAALAAITTPPSLTTAVPIPPAMPLLAAAFAALGFLRLRRNRAA